MKQEIRDVATVLDLAAKQVNSTEQVSLKQTISLDAAYEIQAASIEKRLERGEKLVGYKLGFTSKEKMEQMGVHDIIWGRLTNAMHIEHSGSLDRKKFIHPRVEPEIAFRISKRIDKLISLEEVTNYFDAVAGALEVIDSRYKNFKFSLEDVVADNCSSAAFVLGDWLDSSTAVQNLSIALNINNQDVKTGNSSAILGNPLESLVEISKMMVQYNETIEAGSIILAGAATAAVHINATDKIEGHFENLGTVNFTVI